MKRVHVNYFAILRDQRGCSSEDLETDSMNYDELYEELRTRYGFTLSRSLVRVAVNGAFRDGAEFIQEGDEIVFIPPVAGG